MASLSASSCCVLALVLLALCCTGEAGRGLQQATTPEEAAMKDAKAKVNAATAVLIKAKARLAGVLSMCDTTISWMKPSCQAKRNDMLFSANSAVSNARVLQLQAQATLKEAQKTLADYNTPEARQKRLDDAKASLQAAEDALFYATAARKDAQRDLDRQAGDCEAKTPASPFGVKGNSAYLKCISPKVTILDKAMALESDAGKAVEDAKEKVQNAGG